MGDVLRWRALRPISTGLENACPCCGHPVRMSVLNAVRKSPASCHLAAVSGRILLVRCSGGVRRADPCRKPLRPRTRATRCGALTARQRAWAGLDQLECRCAARAGPLGDAGRKRTVAKVDSILWSTGGVRRARAGPLHQCAHQRHRPAHRRSATRPGDRCLHHRHRYP